MLSLLGLTLVLSCVILLLTGKMSPLITFSTIPIIIALIAGFSPSEVRVFFTAGLTQVTPIAVMFIFAILFFSFMQERGLFEPLIKSIIGATIHRPAAVPMATVVIATIAHIDGSGASTFLICLPALLPIYERLRLSPYLLLLLVSASASVMNMLPWGGPLGRAASVIKSDPTELWYALIPIQISALFILLIVAYVLGHREGAHLSSSSSSSSSSLKRKEGEATHTSDPSSEESHIPVDQPDYSLSDTYWWINLGITLGVIIVLFSGIFPSALVFMMALSIALILNKITVSEQREFLSRNAWNALQMAMIIFAAGVFLGVLKESKMLHALAESLIYLLPENVLAHIHIIIGFLGVPFELILNTDAYYFALLPIVEQAVQPYSVSSHSVVYAMLIGNIIGTFVSPFSPALWLGLGLTKLEIGPYIRYAFVWIWCLSIALMSIAWAIGLF